MEEADFISKPPHSFTDNAAELRVFPAGSATSSCSADPAFPIVTVGSLKVCSLCGLGKSLSDFYSKGNRSDASCKTCVKKQKSASYKAAKAIAVDKRKRLEIQVREARINEVICSIYTDALTSPASLGNLLQEFVVSLLIDDGDSHNGKIQ